MGAGQARGADRRTGVRIGRLAALRQSCAARMQPDMQGRTGILSSFWETAVPRFRVRFAPDSGSVYWLPPPGSGCPPAPAGPGFSIRGNQGSVSPRIPLIPTAPRPGGGSRRPPGARARPSTAARSTAPEARRIRQERGSVSTGSRLSLLAPPPRRGSKPGTVQGPRQRGTRERNPPAP